jgi:ABC-type Mn2+/Zn2+ transport system permease subunit
MLYPLVPKGFAGLAVAAASGVIATTWAIVSVAALSWLNRRKRHRLASSALGLVVALQLGIGIFALARYHQDLLANYFSYFGR